jgi:hypothetical protein
MAMQHSIVDFPRWLAIPSARNRINLIATMLPPNFWADGINRCTAGHRVT